jgi:hypothetical protein
MEGADEGGGEGEVVLGCMGGGVNLSGRDGNWLRPMNVELHVASRGQCRL